MIRRSLLATALAALLCSCGYHVGGKADLVPKSIQTIAVPPFTTNSMQYQLPDQLANAIAREFNTRTRFTTVKDPSKADAVLTGNINSVYIVPVVSDPNTGKATSVQAIATLTVKLVQRETGRVLYSRPNFQIRSFFEIPVDPHQYFDESGPAYDRLSQAAAQDVVSAVVEKLLTLPALNPDQFLARIAKQPLAPAYLFLGPEGYYRRACREALLTRALTPENRAEGFTLVDLEETSVSNVLDDARSLSLFAADRVLWITSAELALPRRMTSTSDDDEKDTSGVSGLSSYLKRPTPGTILVFECSRFDFSGDDKPKLDRVQKFYSSIPAVVEFRPLTPESSRQLAQTIAREKHLKLGGPELAVLLDACAGDAGRLVSEIEKLALFVDQGRAVTMEDISSLVPNAAQSSIFNLVNALGRRDRVAALRSLDILVREGEYLPLALTFLSTQFRLALAAKEARLTSTQQAQNYFTQAGVRIWRHRAEQVIGTANAFTKDHLDQAVAAIYETDRKFRDGYRDDRVVMETLVLQLTSSGTSRSS